MAGIYDFGADVDTPLRAKLGGEGGWSFAANASLSLIDEKGTAGQLCPAATLQKTELEKNQQEMGIGPTFPRQVRVDQDAEVISVRVGARNRSFCRETASNWPAYLERALLS